jgi:dihydrofolate reductase
MRQVIYQVAASVDGYIAGPSGEVDWIVHDPEVNLAKIYEAVDTVLLGRRTYELTRQPGAPPWPRNWQIYVFSRTLPPEEHPGVTVVRADAGARVAALRAAAGRDIWLFGGGNLFRSLLEAGQVDLVGLLIIPVLLGDGIPLLETGASRTRLALEQVQQYPSGLLGLQYRILRSSAAPPASTRRTGPRPR